MRASDSSVYTDFVMWLARDLASLGLGHPVCLLNLSSGWPRDLALLGLSQPMWYLWHCHSYSMLNLIFKFIVNESFKLKVSSVYTDFVMWLARDLASLGLSHPLHFEFIFWLAQRPCFARSQPPRVPVEFIFWQAKRP